MEISRLQSEELQLRLHMHVDLMAPNCTEEFLHVKLFWGYTRFMWLRSRIYDKNNAAPSKFVAYLKR